MVNWELTVDGEESIFAVLLYLVMPELRVVINREYVIVRRGGTFANKKDSVHIADLRLCELQAKFIQKLCFRVSCESCFWVGV